MPVMMEKVNLSDKLALFSDVWRPKVVGELNNQAEAHVLLLEPASTLNTGNVHNERTVEAPERL